MSTGLILAMILSVIIGISLGLLGGGGTILAVPLLTYVAGMPPKEAIAASMFIIGVTSAVSVVAHAKRGNVQWRTGFIFGAAAMVGAFGGGLLGSRLPSVVLMVAFGIMMVATALAMILDRRAKASGQPRKKLPLAKILIEGLVVGLVTGMVGAGGGFLVVPALVLLGGLSMPAAVGTSLLIISMKSFTGLAGYLTSVSIDWVPVLIITVITVIGALIGTAFGKHVPEKALKKAFGYLVLAMGVVVFLQELPLAYGLGAAAAIVVLLGTLLYRRRGDQLAT
ncbi:sulfite exporter TauE/SafE family protein [Nesterenkonia sp. LB17]|uniref:sulfite exporter TauE/SafE family protein n=1 Tax=unclassified Nesterenkonia TaxID=2629769 RepID=UPI001F4C8754|nr:sulfite exporter TauE/SafE family protein [Nesterenkonia sp. DZ6]MCH8561864.1 sulfite exporter TauE/SafE family protein [Nesterenkonia sp. YGD6]MCH8564599.1 sulfite exporter TauE/SafE family protein [Nesterenkonia sp. LB17]MCH8570225.1 sulfite exporter TauE/SafE family protein [Nesterenkonia sp. AY15]